MSIFSDSDSQQHGRNLEMISKPSKRPTLSDTQKWEKFENFQYFTIF